MKTRHRTESGLARSRKQPVETDRELKADIARGVAYFLRQRGFPAPPEPDFLFGDFRHSTGAH